MTCMKHNDRLGQLLDSVLRPYHLEVFPRPKITLFLNIDTLVAWYSKVLDEEMSGKVQNVMEVICYFYNIICQYSNEVLILYLMSSFIDSFGKILQKITVELLINICTHYRGILFEKELILD